MLDRLRDSLIARRYAIAVVAGIAVLTIALLVVTDLLSARFAEQLRSALEARAQHGARELAAVAAAGAAHDDPRLFNAAIEDYVTSPDLQTIAIEANGQTLVSHGELASVTGVFAALPNVVVRGPGYVASWAAGPTQMKVAVVLSTAALDDIAALQAEVSYLLFAIGVTGVVGFVAVRRWRREPAPRLVAAPSAGEPSAQADDASALALQQVLEHASQGFVFVDLATQLIGDHAKIVAGWLGTPGADATLGSYVGGDSSTAAMELSAGLSRLHEGSVADGVAQLPARIARDERTFDLRYAPIVEPGRLLIILTDVTAELARAAAAREAREQREISTLAALVTTNRAEFDEFFAEVARLLAAIEAPSDAAAELATVRALKDSCGYYGLDGFVELCASVEASLRETSAPMPDVQRLAVSDGWSRIASRLMRASAAAS